MSVVRIRYQTIEFDYIDIHLRCLRDKQQISAPLGEAQALSISGAQWSLFDVVWESSQILAEKMQDFNIKDKRNLEVGCGIGLSILLLNARDADITSTDYHPEVGRFLAKNVALNSGKEIPFYKLTGRMRSLDLVSLIW